jgi:hypothetical protein
VSNPGEAFEDQTYEKRRRNLIGASLVLFAAIASDARFTKMSLLGIEVSTSVDVLVAYWIVPFYLYFLLRYWQKWEFRSFSDDYKKVLYEASMRYVERVVKPRYSAGVPSQPSNHEPSRPFKGSVNFTPVVSVGRGQCDYSLIRTTYADADNRTVVEQATLENGKLPPLPLSAAHCRALWTSVVQKNVGTEHIFPFLIAAAPPLYALYRWLSPTMPELLGG